MRLSLLALTAAVALATPFAAQAHRQWIIPSMAVLSGDDPWVTVDAAVSNELFHPDHNAMRLDSVTITAPDGSVSKPENASTGKLRSTFDVHLTQEGTWRIANVNAGLGARWKAADGKPGFYRGAPEGLKAAIPAGATEVVVTQNAGRTETFVTRGKPTEIKLTGKGLELQPVTPLTDLVAGEAGSFKLVMDGKPAANLDVTVLPGGARYRDNPGEIKVKTDADGGFKVTWPDAGLYWINASVRDDKAEAPATQRNVSYNGVVEVLQP
jgi:uncharacterized GH25 family protein